MNWKQYEKEILTYFKETYPETTIIFDKRIIGKFSKAERQIDIFIQGEVAGYKIMIAIDCKYFSSKIDVKQVESFCSMIEDIDAHQGVLITTKGYSKAAINRAYYGNQKIELDILNFDDLKEFQGLMAIPYTGHFSIILPAPFGWVFDIKDKINSFASLHQRGLTLKMAQKRNEWMYMQFWNNKSSGISIDQLIKIQNKNILKIDPETEFIYNSLVKRKDGLKTKIRIAKIAKYPAIEVTGFIEFEENIFFIVMFTPDELLNKNLRKLQYLLNVAIYEHINFDNYDAIKQSLNEINTIDNKEKQADKYYQVGVWYQEMDEFENAFIYFKKVIECCPMHWENLINIISKALYLNFHQESKQYAIQLFQIEPTNPFIPQKLIEIYLNNNKSEILIELFRELINNNKEPEILGNLNFHLGLLYLNLKSRVEGANYFIGAKKQFKKVFPLDHQVFKSIDESLKKNTVKE